MGRGSGSAGLATSARARIPRRGTPLTSQTGSRNVHGQAILRPLVIGRFTSDHGGAGGVSFVDGHGEIHRRREPRTMLPLHRGTTPEIQKMRVLCPPENLVPGT